MPDKTQNEAEKTLENAEIAAEQGDGTAAAIAPVSKLKAVALIAVVVLVECGLAYMFIPGAVADAQTDAAVRDAETALLENEAEKTDEPKQIEIDMGEFRVSSYQPATNTTFRVNFHLYGTVSVDEQGMFVELKQMHEARLREQVNVIFRAAEIDELTDPTLSLIKRRILDKINRTLGKPLVKGVVFSDMTFVEQ